MSTTKRTGLKGYRIFVRLPEEALKDSAIQVDENTKQALNQALMEKMLSIEIVEVGSAVGENTAVAGDFALIDINAIKQGVIIPHPKHGLVSLLSSDSIITVWTKEESDAIGNQSADDFRNAANAADKALGSVANPKVNV